MPRATSEIGPRRHCYGSDPSQFADLHLPAGQRRPGTVVLIHGGWWGPNHGADHLDGVAADLDQAGLGDVEHRVPPAVGGGYPSTLEDAAAAIDHLVTLADADTDRVVAMATAPAATWPPGRPGRASWPPVPPVPSRAVHLTGVISLAGVLDLGAAARQKSGNGAVIDFIGGAPNEYPDRYAVADPLSQVPIPAAVRCVHAQADDRVPFAQSVTYVAAAQAVGQDAQLREVVGDHFSVADARRHRRPAVHKTVLEAFTRPAYPHPARPRCPLDAGMIPRLQQDRPRSRMTSTAWRNASIPERWPGSWTKNRCLLRSRAARLRGCAMQSRCCSGPARSRRSCRSQPGSGR